MNIYFVNRNSRWKGPFDVIDAKRNHIIAIGDLCILDTEKGLHLLLVENDNNTWLSCKKIGEGNNLQNLSIANTILFSFDGIHQRIGNKSILQELIGCFSQSNIVNILYNALDILTYKKDFWEFEVLQQLFCNTFPPAEYVDKKKDTHNLASNNDYPSIFASYLDDRLLSYIYTSLNEGKSLREIYASIREKSPESFRTAFIRFTNEYPEKTIYDKFSSNKQQTDSFLSGIGYINKDAIDNIRINEHNTSLNSISDVNEQILEERTNKTSNILFNDIVRDPSYTKISTIDLFRKYHNGDIKARTQLVINHLRMAMGIAKKYRNNGFPLEDIIQEGFIGLISAIEKFNYKLNSNFSSYAEYLIETQIKNFLARYQHLIKIPQQHFWIHNSIRKYCNKFEQDHEYEPSLEEVEINKSVNPIILKSIYELPDDLSNMVVRVDDFDIFLDESSPTDMPLIQESIKLDVGRLMRILPSRNQFILESIFGLNNTAQVSLELIGKRLHLTRERVRQIKEKSLRLLRKALTKDNDEEEELEVKTGKVEMIESTETMRTEPTPLERREANQENCKKDEKRQETNRANERLKDSTPLWKLVAYNLLTTKECKHCNHKGLMTIGDVKKIIEKNSLTRESTRFTQYTLDIWFKIVDLYDTANHNDESIKSYAKQKKIQNKQHKKSASKSSPSYKSTAKSVKKEDKTLQKTIQTERATPVPYQTVRKAMSVEEKRTRELIRVLERLNQPTSAQTLALYINKEIWGGGKFITEEVEYLLRRMTTVAHVPGKGYILKSRLSGK